METDMFESIVKIGCAGVILTGFSLLGCFGLLPAACGEAFDELKLAVEYPDMWYERVGDHYIATPLDCESKWEDLNDEKATGAEKYCERLVKPPSVSGGAPTGVVVRYAGKTGFSVVDSVELIISAAEMDFAEETGDYGGRDEVFATAMKAHVGVGDCEQFYTRYFQSQMFLCGLGQGYIYASRFSSRPEVESEVRLWVTSDLENIFDELQAFATEEHVRLAEEAIERGDEAAERHRWVEAEDAYGEALLMLVRNSLDGHIRDEDQELWARAGERYEEIEGEAREVRQERGLFGALPSHAGYVYLPMLVTHHSDALDMMLARRYRTIEWSHRDHSRKVTYSDRLSWEIEIEEDKFGHREVKAVFSGADMPFEKESLRKLGVRVTDPDEVSEASMRWENIQGIGFIELINTDKSGVTVVRAGN